MRKIVFSLFLLLFTVGTAAQKKDGTVTGVVSDAVRNEAVPGASVTLYSLPDSVLAVGVGTAFDGSFKSVRQSGIKGASPFVHFLWFVSLLKYKEMNNLLT